MDCIQEGVKYECSLHTDDESGDFRIRAWDTDSQESVNDNDQQYYKINVVEDAGSGMDACKNELCSDAIYVDTSGQEITGYFIKDYSVNDDEDTYVFNVIEGQRVDIEFSSEYPAVMNLKFRDSLDYLSSDQYTLSANLRSSLDHSVTADDIVVPEGAEYGIINIKRNDLLSPSPKLLPYRFSVSTSGGEVVDLEYNDPIIDNLRVTYEPNEGYYSGVYADDGGYASDDVYLEVSTFDRESGIDRIEFLVNYECDGSSKLEPCVVYADDLDSNVDDGRAKWNTDLFNDGTNYVEVRVYDNNGNWDYREFEVEVDNEKITVSIDEPKENDALHGIVNLKAIVSDDYSGIDEVNWYIDDTKIGSGEETIWGAYGLEGTHTLKVVARDNVGNEDDASIDVELFSPDLYLGSEDISVSGTLESGSTVTISADVHNDGNMDAEDIMVEFYVDGEAVGYDTIASIPQQQQSSASATWLALGGERQISVVVDPENDIFESDEGNNLASKIVDVSIEENCGSLIVCESCDEEHICDCGNCGSATSLDNLPRAMKCSYLDEANEHSLYTVEVGTEPVSVFLTFPESVDYGLYVAEGSCSNDLVIDRRVGLTKKSYKLANEGTYYIEVRRESGSNEPYRLYVGVEVDDDDQLPDEYDSEVTKWACVDADEDDSGMVELAEVVEYITLWSNGDKDLPDVVGVITCWYEEESTFDDPMYNIEGVVPSDMQITRNAPDSWEAGSSFTVTLNINIDENDKPPVFAIREEIPRNWEIVDSIPEVDHVEGYYGLYEWLFWDMGNEVQDTSITYTVKTPKTDEGYTDEISGWLFYKDEGADIAIPTGRSDIEVTQVECMSGPCCDPSTNSYRGTDYVCDPYHEVDISCNWGTSPGDDVGFNHMKRYCSGTSSACDGAISDWLGWQVYEDCDAEEVCEEGNSQCVEFSAASGCNPPASGDWNIEQFTECFSQQIALSGGSLLLYDDLELEGTSVTAERIVFKEASRITLKEASIKLESG